MAVALASRGRSANPDLVCLAHLSWDGVYQRPQHLMTRFARDRRLFFVGECADTTGEPSLEVEPRGDGLTVVTPNLPDVWGEDRYAILRRLLDGLFARFAIRDYALWYYTPMALPCTRQFLPAARAVAYDCMDELAAFHKAPPRLVTLEDELFREADVVFTGGQSLYEAKRRRHPDVHPFPSSVDIAHFARARRPRADPADQAAIPRPRLGYAGVIDERMDLDLVAALAEARPDWHLIMLGPVAKIDARALPRRPNLHYLGKKPYDDLPAYMAGWDAAWLPFARNEATRYISPTKTPEYLAAGLPVVSTPIRDVVRPYGERGLVAIAEDAAAAGAALDAGRAADRATRQARVDAFLAGHSWDRTQAEMDRLLAMAALRRAARMLPALTAGEAAVSSAGIGALAAGGD